MGFWKKLFRKNKYTEEPEETSDWDAIQSEKEYLNMKDPAVREQYVRSCLDKMREASGEIDRINAEYSLVTSYLTDMEEIEALKDEEKKPIENIARHLHDLRAAHDSYVLSPSLMSEEEYNRMEKMADDVPDGIKKLQEEEEYKEKVKQDLMRLDREKRAYEYRRHEVKTAIANARGIAGIAIAAAVVLTFILLVLQLALKMDVIIGYYITIAVAALALTIIYVKYTDRVREQDRINNTMNELILLENKVKIRYVNNRNLLDYLYTKFGVHNCAELKSLYEKFVKEEEERRKFERNEVIYEDELSRLVNALKRFRIKDPQIWIHQADALYDPREMVEIRHGLIGRRQKLRKQLEYNEQIAVEASDEVKDIIKNYPDYASSIMSLVELYQKESGY